MYLCICVCVRALVSFFFLMCPSTKHATKTLKATAKNVYSILGFILTCNTETLRVHYSTLKFIGLREVNPDWRGCNVMLLL